MTTHTLPKRTMASLLAGVLLLSVSCARTNYVELGNEEWSLVSPLRHVGVKLDPAYVDYFPNCTIVLEPETGIGLESLRPFVEETLVRHLSRKMTRVIDAYERELLARQNSLDLRHKHDQEELAEIAGCDTLLTSRVVGPGMTSAVVWSQVQIGIEALMMRPDNGHVIWRGRHIADRSKGGIPFSPLSIVVNTFSSLNFMADQDIAESIIDDAIRRIVRSIPDSRILESSSG